jgi:type VI secretion system protein ImpK
VRESLYAVVMAHRQPPHRDLSPRWRGLEAAWRPPGRAVPVWVIGALAAAILGGLYAFFAFSLNSRSDAVFAQVLQVPPLTQPALARVAPPPPPPPPPPAQAGPDQPTRIATFLAPEIREGLVAVLASPQVIVIRIKASGMFASAQAEVTPRFVPILQRIGNALKDEPGDVLVVGHSDSIPIRTVRFPSNYHLSTARAESARAVIARTIGDPNRLRSEGRADAEPIADNATPEGREQNRRIELIMPRMERPL